LFGREEQEKNKRKNVKGQFMAFSDAQKGVNNLPGNGYENLGETKIAREDLLIHSCYDWHDLLLFALLLLLVL
jgi:hypothetical protein